MGKFTEAEKAQSDAIAIFTKTYGPEHMVTMKAMDALGAAISVQGRHAEAEKILTKVVKIQSHTLGKLHSETLESMSDLAWSISRQGRIVEAESLFREALKNSRITRGEEHPLTFFPMDGLARVLGRQGKLTEAEKLGRKTLAIRQRVLGAEHFWTVQSIQTLALIMQDQGRLEEARELSQQAAAILSRTFGKSHLKTLNSLNSLGAILNTMGKNAEAVTINREALKGFRQTLGDEHVSTLTSINNLGYSLNKIGRHKDACKLLSSGESAARRAWTGADIRWLGNYLAKLGEAEGATNQFEKSEITLLEAHRFLKEGFGVEHPRTTACVERLIALYESWHAAKPENGYRIKAAELQRVEQIVILHERQQRAEALNASANDHNSYAWWLLTIEPAESRDPATALLEANKAVEKSNSQDFYYLDTLALAQQTTGGIDAAIDIEKDAIALLPPGPSSWRTSFESSLAKYLTERGNYLQAEILLLAMHQQLYDNPKSLAIQKQGSIQRIISLYESWHSDEPDKDYDAKAEEWRAKLAKPETAAKTTDE